MSHFFYNSEAMFNVIGDYPVVDQFDVSYSGMLAGSTYDNYVTGSMFTLAYNVFTGKNFYSFTYPQQSRGLAFNKLDTNSLPGVKGTHYNPNSYELQPQRERSGILRNIKIFSNSERFYDSMTPNLTKYVKALNGRICVDSNGKYSDNNSGIIYYNWLTSPKPDESIEDLGESFPFQPRFSNIERVKKISSSLIADLDYSIATGLRTTIPPKPLKRLFVRFYGEPTRSDGGTGQSIIRLWCNRSPTPVGLVYEDDEGCNSSDIAKVIFGIPYGYELEFRSFSFGSPSVRRWWSMRNKFPEARRYYGYFQTMSSPPSLTEYGTVSPIIRGWKYGLIDGNPHYTSCIFRRDRYGQLRDMLEQRLNSAFVNDEENAPLASSFVNDESLPLPAPQPEKAAATLGGFTTPNIFNNFSSLNVLKADPPVRVNFTRHVYIESSGELIYFNQKPTETWSSNLSPYATSSLPYFDNESRNRGASSTPLNTTIISSLSDVFGNITI